MIGTSSMQNTELLHLHHLKSSASGSSRILDIPCKVCGDFSSGKHYNIFACDGCAGFFKRSIRRNRQYVCKAKPEGGCLVDKTHRNQCRACRLTKCQEAGMNKDAVQHERGPRNSTLRRQHMSQYLTSTGDLTRDPRFMLHQPMPTATVLNLAIPKVEGGGGGVGVGAGGAPQQLDQPPLSMLPGSMFMCNPTTLAALAYNYQSHQGHSHTHGPHPGHFTHVYNNNPATICESAAQLLFMNVKWAKSVPSFTSLLMSDQLILLEESWRELFILGASQFRVPLELSSLVQACGVMQGEPERIIPFLQDVKDFQDLLAKIGQFNLDPHEYACLRAIVLFKTTFDRSCSSPVSSTSGNNAEVLRDPATVASIQDSTQLVLNKYISTAQPCQPLRFGKLLMLMPQLRTINGETIEELFFRSTIGTIPIVRIISDMYKSTSISGS